MTNPSAHNTQEITSDLNVGKRDKYDEYGDSAYSSHKATDGSRAM